MSKFMKSLCKIAIPVTLQSMLDLAGAIAVSSLLIIFSGVYTGFYRVDYICFICTC